MKPPSIVREPFRGLQGHVADEAVAHDDVRRALEDVVAFDVAVEVQLAAAQQFGGLLDDVVALDHFLADVQQADRGPLLLLDRLDERGAEDGELEQVIGTAVDVGAEVEHRREPAPLVRDHAGDGRPVDAVERLQDETRDRHQGAGVARADADIRAALLHEVDRHAHRRIALGAQRDGDRVVHLDDLVGVNDLDGRRDARRQRGLDLGLAPDQDQGRIRLVLQEREGGWNGDRNAVVTAHAIDGDSHRHRRLANAARTRCRSALARGSRTWGSMTVRSVARWASRVRDGRLVRPYSSFLVATTFLPR